MKKQLYSFLILLSFVVSVSAQKARLATDVEENLQKYIEYLASDKLEGRRAGEKGATDAAAYIANEFAKLKLKPGVRGANGKIAFLQPFSYTPVQDPHSTPTEPTAGAASNLKAAYNVVGVLEGRGDVLKNEAIVIGAHYDHLGKGGRSSLAANSTEIHYGADDNASGVAALIEIARQWANAKTNHRTLIFIAFSGEEDGLFGSKHYINYPVFPLDKTIAMVNLDMIGRLNGNKLTIGGIGTATEWRGVVTGLNKIPVPANGDKPYTIGSFDLQLSDDGFGPSDHSSFYGKQIPVLFFFTGTHLDYHKPSDTADKINIAGAASVTNYVKDIVRYIDQTATRPSYTVAKSSATPGGRTGFSVSLGTIPTYADSTDGMLLDGVRENSPASRAGLKAGDKIVKLAGKDIKNVYDYTAIMGEMKPDVEYEVVITRGGETLTLKIVPVKRP